MEEDRIRLRRWVYGLTLLALLAVALWQPLSPVHAQSDLPDRPRPITLPPRALPPEDMGAYIELQVNPPPPRQLWTEVQWQAGNGEWRTVDGWMGLSRPNGQLRWYVEQAHLGNGPFRWVVYRRFGGELLGNSAPFALPDLGRQVQVVQVTTVLTTELTMEPTTVLATESMTEPAP